MQCCNQRVKRSSSPSNSKAMTNELDYSTIVPYKSSMDLYTISGSMDQSPASSPRSSHEHPQDMICTSTMSGDCSSNASMDPGDQKIGDNSPKRLCLVCGDIASGFHYGVASCEACKAFFKRTIQGNIEYTCPATSDCEINKRRRKACQACRFQKCLRMGMLKEGVRLDRVRGGRQKYRRNAESPFQVQTPLPSRKSSLEDNKIVNALLACEPEQAMLPNSAAGGGGSSSATNLCTLGHSPATYNSSVCTLSDLVDKELVATIVWAKQIPGFTDLILNDQMRLLQSSWGEVLALSLAYRSHQQLSPPSSSIVNTASDQPPAKLLFASDFIMDDAMSKQCKCDELFNYCLLLVKRLNSLKLAREEYLVMKALLLVNVDIPLEDSHSVCKLRDTLLTALQECVSALRPYNSVAHLTQMLLALPLLRQTDGSVRRFWSNVRSDGKVPMNKLFVEMLESSIAFR